MTDGSDPIRHSLERQAVWCRALGSPMYAHLLEVALVDYDRQGPVADVVGGYRGDPVTSVLALRLMGGVHRLVLMGLAPGLARHFPSVGGTPDLETIGRDFLATVAEHPGYLIDALDVAPQTNEVGRSMVLLPGLMAVTEGLRYDVRLLGIGASGGLNLLLDRFHYRTDSWEWGDATSPVALQAEWSGPRPPLHRVDVAERRGCDSTPIDVTDPESELRLLSFVWADQRHRIDRLRGAITIARADPPIVDRSGAADWLQHRLDRSVPRRTITVVQHSIMWQYVDATEQRRIRECLAEAGARATRSRPLALVAFEPSGGAYSGSDPQLHITRWPGGDTRGVATAQAHGAVVRWTG